MNVFVLVRNNYEDCEILGVFATRWGAEAALDRAENFYKYGKNKGKRRKNSVPIVENSYGFYPGDYRIHEEPVQSGPEDWCPTCGTLVQDHDPHEHFHMEG